MLNWTGERYLPGKSPRDIGAEIHYEHLHRYLFARHFIEDKNVLDLACGEGYGSFLLSQKAKMVVGIDIDKNAIEHAKNKYSKNNLTYLEASFFEVPCRSMSFDIIVCFEAIEHVNNHSDLLREIIRLLSPDGFLLISTPNRIEYSDKLQYSNPFHCNELNFDEFDCLLKKFFQNIYYYGQKVATGSTIWKLFSEGHDNPHNFFIKWNDNEFSITDLDQLEPMYYLAIASNKKFYNNGDISSLCIDVSNSLVVTRDLKIGEFETKNQELQNINRELLKELKSIKESLVWQSIQKYRGYEKTLFPPMTRRGNIYHLIIKFLGLTIREGPKKSLYLFKQYLKTRKGEQREPHNVESVTNNLLKHTRNKKTRYIQDLYANSCSLSSSYVSPSRDSISLKKDDIKLIAFYLPQFHPIPENDQWWGKGFTEWTNVTKAIPQFIGHYQPHLPTDLGFYDLRVPEIQIEQVNLAKKYGIFGFCFHYYWFEGRRILEIPLKNYLSNNEIDFPFCICWANENWTRRWDGLENEVLLSQNHSIESNNAFIKDIIPLFQDSRYIRINGKPLLIVYRIGLLPDAKATAKSWRDYCIQQGIGDLYLVAAQGFGLSDPREYGFDAAVEFPPHTMNNLSIVTRHNRIMNPHFKGTVYDYEEYVKSENYLKKVPYTLFKCVCPSWDNTARKPNNGSILHNTNPDIYKKWLSNVIDYTKKNNHSEEQLVFINAWNEWAEGAHLEPDRKFGHGYLKATADAILEQRVGEEAKKK